MDFLNTAQQGMNVVLQGVRQKAGKHTHKHKNLSRRERLGIELAQQSYKEPNKRKFKIKGYKYVSEYSNSKFSVYKTTPRLNHDAGGCETRDDNVLHTDI